MLFYYFNGRSVVRTCRHFGISRQTFYRWKRHFNCHDITTLEDRSHRPHKVRTPTWTAELAERVLALRKQYPIWGKDKLVVLLCKQKLVVSTSMVGRILRYLKRRGILLEPPRPAVLLRQRRKLRKRPWAVRKPKYWRIREPGDLVEIDTKEIHMRHDVVLKHFSARDVVSRWDVIEVHRWATSLAAARFLEVLLDRLPFPVKALQVDGGSEFAAEFELACQQKQLPLFVLPPKSPKLNGHVERSHRTTTRSFMKCTRTPTNFPCSTANSAAGKTSTTACGLTSPRLPHSARLPPSIQTKTRKGKCH
jgi:transposase-like protein